MITTGVRIKSLREAKGLTQRELGIAVGFNPENAGIRISQYENNQRLPKKAKLEKIAQALDSSPEFLTCPFPSTKSEIALVLDWIYLLSQTEGILDLLD